MTANKCNTPIIQAVDKETIRTLASLPRENQMFIKGIILGLYNQPAPSAGQQARPG